MSANPDASRTVHSGAPGKALRWVAIAIGGLLAVLVLIVLISIVFQISIGT